MSTANAATFACDACGKSYRWRPEFAGKKLKCACGNIINVTEAAATASAPMAAAPLTETPHRAPAAANVCPDCSSPVAPGAALCTNCGFNLLTGSKIQTQVDAGAPRAVKKKKAKGAALNYASKSGAATSFPRRILADDPEEVAARARWDDIYWPSIAVVIGTILNFVDAMWAQQIQEWKFIITWVALFTLVDVIISFIGVLITAKLLSIGLGTVPTALLKVTAIALAPGAISSMIATKIPMGWTLAWSLSLILYYIMFNKFFDMDPQEIMICAAIIWITRTWLAYFLVMMILNDLMGFRSILGSADFGDDNPMPSNQIVYADFVAVTTPNLTDPIVIALPR